MASRAKRIKKRRLCPALSPCVKASAKTSDRSLADALFCCRFTFMGGTASAVFILHTAPYEKESIVKKRLCLSSGYYGLHGNVEFTLIINNGLPCRPQPTHALRKKFCIGVFFIVFLRLLHHIGCRGPPFPMCFGFSKTDWRKGYEA